MRHPRGFDDLKDGLADLRRRDMYRVRRNLEGPQGREVTHEGRVFLNFSSNDYLGLAGDPRVAEAFKRGIDRWGTGTGASHLISGHTAAHEELEEALAALTGRPRALLYGSGYAANVGVINALLSVGDFVFQDRLNHASLLDGGWISRATFSWFEHRDSADLGAKLVAVQHEPTRKLIVSDGTFSMDGDACRLDVRMFCQHLFGRGLTDSSGVLGMVVIHFLLPLIPGKAHLAGVDDNDKVSVINMGGKSRLIFSA